MILGLIYRNGEGVQQDFKKTLKWYRLSAEQGNSAAQTKLGFMYDYGKGVLQDYKKAHMFYNLGAYNGNALGEENRDLLAKIMTLQQISEAQDMAREWLDKHGQ